MKMKAFLTLWILQIFQASAEKTWTENCPPECNCQTVPSSETLISQWTKDGSTVKTVMCVFRNDSINSMLDLPTDIESLTILQENDDNFTSIVHDDLIGFQQLKSVNLQGSLLGGRIHIANDLFRDLDNLRYLSLQRADITGAEKAFAKLPSLEVLYVIHCDIGFLRWEMLSGLKSLKELYLVQSGVKELHGFAFYGTPELRRLFLSHNDLFSVEADAFVGLLKLEYLDLSNNRIDHLSGLTFPPLPHLQWLELKHNPIKVIFPHCFQYLNGTQHLTLGHRRQPVRLMKFSFRGLFSLLFLHIPNIDNDALFEHMFYDLKSLSHLNLTGRVKLINNRAFNGAHKVLTKLILHNCQLERVFEDSFFGLEKLRHLDLSGNLLKSLPEKVFRHLKSVQHIRLSGNMLKDVSYEPYLSLGTLKSLGLYDNPWNCTCTLADWKADIVLAIYEDSPEACNGTCTNENILNEEINREPKCEYPEEYKAENVFRVVNLLKCSQLSNK